MAFQPKFDAVIFDLDGVITKTALVHASAWKKMFDEFMKSREERLGELFKEFTHAGDYLPYVDGKPRYKGVASFLESRGIDIPFGDPADEPEQETVCGLGNRKNIMFNEVLDAEGVEVYETSVEMLHGLKAAGVRIGVASSSKNCKPVLEKAGLLHLFETRIDGVVSAEIGLNGKPEPDIFTTACDRLGVEYHRAVVVEDAVSGVQAGRKGNFGLVLGVAREENTRELLVGGGDIVVEDLGDIGLEGINNWFENGMERDGWLLRFFDYEQDMERSREALLAVGNGYFGTRGAMEESSANKVNYPGTYIAGLFNRLVSKVGDRDIENEDFVNISNWLPVTFRIEDGPWFDFSPEPTFAIRSINRTLDLKSGELFRELLLEDDQGRITRVTSSRFASMADPHCAGLRYTITPLNYEGRIEIRSEVRGDHRNSGVERYNELNQQHLAPVSEEVLHDKMKLVVKTTQSDILIAVCAGNRIVKADHEIEQSTRTGGGWISQSFKIQADKDKEIVLEKMVSIFTSRDPGVEDPSADAESTLHGMSSYKEEVKRSAGSWMKIWDKIDIGIEGDREAQRLVRLHQFHMMVAASPHHAGLDSGIPPRGLHGEAYRGHIFWDELYILPLYNLHFPEVVKSVLMYRYRRLDAARAYAKEYGYDGAMFPWQSGSDGREETQVIHLNPLSGEWGDDYSSLQRHISLAIAFNVWNYYHVTGDLAFMDHHGAEILLDICKFWASKSRFNEGDGRYHIDKVMGPDEFHEKLPGSVEGGLTNNAYSNIMVSWMMDKAFRILDDLTNGHKERILKKLSLTRVELDRWEKIMHGLSLHISDEGVVEQFQGYFDLAELDWDFYRKEYGNIHRLDRILKSEGKSPDDFKLSKQADFLMSFYNLGNPEVTAIIEGLGHILPEGYLKTNFGYYINRTSHGSTLSRLVHARLAWQMGLHDTGWGLYMDALRSDLVDIQGGTTGEGIHAGVMAGTVYDVISTFAGLNLRGDVPELNPSLPVHWKGLEFKFSFRGCHYKVKISGNEVKISGKNAGKEKIKVHLCGKEIELSQDEPVSVKLN
ncbi:MAG: beta-phosphoglucomutase family hydrolase [Bacteroidales bacterium]|nr:beta-phosphoglucomutase family hydrolase [Bacteroidales bacterium]